MKAYLLIFTMICTGQFSVASTPDNLTQLKVLINILQSPLASAVQKELVENFYANGVAECTVNDCVSKIFDCDDANEENLKICRIGYSDEVRERYFTHNYGVEVKVSNTTELNVLSIQDYDEEK